MKITSEEIEYIAALARLDLGREEAADMARGLDRILSYVDKLNELDTAGVAPTTQAISIVNAFRADELQESLPRGQALANGPVQNGEAFVVPRVI